MSAFARQWSARIAPISEPARIWDEGKLVNESIAAHAFGRVNSGERRVPVKVNHDENLLVGFVDLVFQHKGWHWAAFRLDRSLPGSEVAAEYVRIGMPVSAGFRTFMPLRTENHVEHRIALFDELSLLGAGVKPVYEGAAIVYEMKFPELERPKPSLPKSPTAAPTSDRAAVGEPYDERPAVGIGQVLGVR